MLSYIIETPYGKATAKINVSDGDAIAPVEIKGESDAKGWLTHAIETNYGIFGHSVSVDGTTAIDLESALQQAKVTRTVEKGQDILDKWTYSFSSSEIS